MNSGEKWVEGGIHNSRRIVWTNSDVFLDYKLPCDVLNNDKWDSLGLDQHQESSELYWWCHSRNTKRGGSWWDNEGSSEKISGK